MKILPFLLLAAATAAGVSVLTAARPTQSQDTMQGPAPAAGQPVPIFDIKIPEGYRDWRLISVAHEEGDLHSLGAILGNDVAIKAFRDAKLPYPDGTIIAALHFKNVPSEENDKIFGKPQSFVPGAPTNVQFMVKDSQKYARTGGWGFAHFDSTGKPGDTKLLSTCAPCHAKASRDFVFTQYAP